MDWEPEMKRRYYDEAEAEVRGTPGLGTLVACTPPLHVPLPPSPGHRAKNPGPQPAIVPGHPLRPLRPQVPNFKV